MADEVMTVKEVAEYLKVHYTTIYRLLKRSQIPAFQIGGDWRFYRERIDEWRLALEKRN
ncbi:MAG: helix-turn-helix domain-containing protein [Candidatus Binataceae bacterium]